MRNVHFEDFNNIQSLASFYLQCHNQFQPETLQDKNHKGSSQMSQGQSFNAFYSNDPIKQQNFLEIKNFYDKVRISLNSFCEFSNENFFSILIYLNSLNPENFNRQRMEYLLQFVGKYSDQLGKYNQLFQVFNKNLSSFLYPIANNKEERQTGGSSPESNSNSGESGQPLSQTRFETNNENIVSHHKDKYHIDKNDNKEFQLQRKDSQSSSLKNFDLDLPEEKEHSEEKMDESEGKSLIKRPKKCSAKKVTACPHSDKRHYAKNMCNNCYHIKGRKKRAWKCPHTDKFHYALGVCQNCYQFLYIQKLKTK